MIAWLATAHAADLGPFAGTWGLDPSRSDDPTQAIANVVVRPAATSGAAGTYAPDQQGDATDAEETRERVIRDALGLLAVSGTIRLAPADGGAFTLTWPGEEPLVLAVDDGWSKLKREDGNWRVRARRDGDRLRIERRYKSTAVVETLIPPEGDELVVVVRVDGSAIDPGVEFRRVYRALE